MKLIVAALLSLILYTSAEAQQKCFVQVINNPGDVIETWVDWWDQGTSGFDGTTRINGIDWRDYGVVPLWEEGSKCLHDCIHISFTAKTANVYVDVIVVSGNASGWKCRQYAQVVGHNPIVIPPVNQRKKDVAIGYRNWLVSANEFFAWYSLPTCGAAMFPLPGALVSFGPPCFLLGLGYYYTDRVPKSISRRY